MYVMYVFAVVVTVECACLCSGLAWSEHDGVKPVYILNNQ